MRIPSGARQLFAAAALLFLTSLCGLAADAPGRSEPPAASPIEIPGIENAFRVSERIFSGSQPEGDAAYAELARLGVRTLISVDGSKPDLAAARRHGLRYVHLPFGYDGIPSGRAAQLQQAARTLEGPIFLHCHHGKHRGPAAVGIVCEAIEGWSPERAAMWLKQAGTAPDYPGLYRAVREFKPIPGDRMEGLGPLPELTETDALVDLMVEIDARFDALKALQKAGWITPPGPADRTPAAQATLLWEQVRELARTGNTAQRPPDYRAKLTDSEHAAQALRSALRSSPPDVAAADAAFKQTSQSCAACHKAFRNEKSPARGTLP